MQFIAADAEHRTSVCRLPTHDHFAATVSDHICVDSNDFDADVGRPIEVDFVGFVA